ncbi:protein MEMO1-like [Symsagittifera roscoffensis]|uniref:protein MEMO1-like n=1 Tax=Symsagittifera roscoffensis TaxID=84072 RepID=UPI00307BD422
MRSSKTRVAEKAGSWYTKEGPKLKNELNSWLENAHKTCNQNHSGGSDPRRAGGNNQRLKAIISPHAGYVYCGVTAAFGFSQINAEEVDRVFILGPSHRMYLEDCALTGHQFYATPVGDLHIDTETVAQLRNTGHFSEMSSKVDREEHSIEMQLPFLAHVLNSAGEGHLERVKIVPILVGALKEDRERFYGQVLAPFLLQPRTIFIISSDFCHWGDRFSYTPYPDKNEGLPIYQSIERLDREGMSIIESINMSNFSKYIQRTKNTICGRHPIAVLLAAVEELKSKHLNGTKVDIRFLHYSQSGPVKKSHDSSVSYAAAKLTFTG